MALHIEHGLVIPLTPKEESLVCEFCLKKCARWLVKLHSDRQPWCARCFLYETAWANSNTIDRDRLIREVEAALGKQIRGSDGRLLQEESDRILSSVVLLAGYLQGIKRG